MPLRSTKSSELGSARSINCWARSSITSAPFRFHLRADDDESPLAFSTTAARRGLRVRRFASQVAIAGRRTEQAAVRGMQSVGAAVNRSIDVPLAQLESKFDSHAADFGITLPRGRAGFDAFGSAIQSHVADPVTIAIPGTLRWKESVTHFYNPNTGLLVVRDGDMAFRSGWRLDADQVRRLMETHNVW